MSSSTVITSADNTREPIVAWLLVLLPIAVGSVASWYQHGLPNANCGRHKFPTLKLHHSPGARVVCGSSTRRASLKSGKASSLTRSRRKSHDCGLAAARF